MSDIDEKAVRARISEAIQRDLDLPIEIAADIGFHMTDWVADLDALHQFYRDPDSPSDEQVVELMMKFLTHVPNHVAAACKLLTGTPVADIFEVGATTEDDVPPTTSKPRFTPLQGQYLAFIDSYTRIHRRPPAEAEIQHHFGVSPPSVHQMILTLERKSLIARTPGEARSIRLFVPTSDLPPLE